MDKDHHYQAQAIWTGAAEGGTINYRAYSRSHTFQAGDKPALDLSADPAFRGDSAKYNPEELLLAALSSCHMLSYLSVAARKGVVVTAYEDRATGTMRQEGTGGHFTEVTLHPIVTVIAGSDLAFAEHLHEEAARDCFIAASMNFPVRHEVEIRVAG
ncbi:MAG TPA: OsmC family protein [Terriglobales bacterium]|nr:OsmC family protein [Terriglobales bacterium]